jgi:hypothetical protein
VPVKVFPHLADHFYPEALHPFVQPIHPDSGGFQSHAM